MELEFSWQIFVTYSDIKFTKIRPVWALLFHADGQIDMTKLIVANASKNCDFLTTQYTSASSVLLGTHNIFYPYIKAGYLSQCSYLETGFSPENYDSISDSGRRFFSPLHPDRVWESPNLLSYRYRGLLPPPSSTREKINGSSSLQSTLVCGWTFKRQELLQLHSLSGELRNEITFSYLPLIVFHSLWRSNVFKR